MVSRTATPEENDGVTDRIIVRHTIEGRTVTRILRDFVIVTLEVNRSIIIIYTSIMNMKEINAFLDTEFTMV